ncbi:ABC transporter permease [Aeromicrobium endophyticum]|uniref:Autoinducer 2 import system permease protein LsrD n=1 Tax=Aeromicrobium endophyticum TaxID=2292704 RepID=A0A371PAG0_9ACTN|nr:ABC transporter permease [Aeromicrobium endophyticum]REK72912.1 ABC transporter permease [Aeromicrobium endophyticum]
MTAVEETPGVRADERKPSRIRVGEFGWIWLGLVGVFVVSAVAAPGTLRPDTLASLLPFAGVLTLASIGQTLVIQQRGLDLSVPGTMAICALTMAKLDDEHTVLVSAIAALGVAVLIGAFNGVIITKLSVTPIITTLAVNSLLVGGAFTYAGGSAVSVSSTMTDFTRAKLLGVPSIVIITVALVLLLASVLLNSVAGRRFVLVGSSPWSARAAGIQVTQYQVGAYVFSAVFAGFAGVLLAGYTGVATADLGKPYLLLTVAAVVIGGTPLSGGRGSLIATAAAALFLSQLDQLTRALGGPSSVQYFVQASALVLASTLRYLAFGSVFRSRDVGASLTSTDGAVPSAGEPHHLTKGS